MLQVQVQKKAKMQVILIEKITYLLNIELLSSTDQEKQP